MLPAADTQELRIADDPAACLRLALAADRDNDRARAIALLKRAIALDGSNPEYHYALGRVHKASDDPESAEAAYLEALRLSPNFLNAWISLGILQRSLGRPVDAERAQREALRIDPRSSLAYLNLGNALLEQQRFPEAAQSFRNALERRPDSAEAHNNLARTLLSMNDPQALAHYERALQLKPDYFSAADGLGNTLLRLGDFEAAERVLNHAVRLQPEAIETRLQLAQACLSIGKLKEAASEIEYVLRAHPRLPKAKVGLASVLTLLGEYDRPKALFLEAIQDSRGDPNLKVCYAVFLLIVGEYAEAWRYYESRLECAGAVERSLPAPRWRDEQLEGRRLLITCEQGLGDELNFASVFPDAIAAAGYCIIECDLRLQSLFRRSFPQATIVGIERKTDAEWHRTLETSLESVPPFDLWIPGGSLPQHFRTSVEAFPKRGGYLIADPDRTAHWRTRLAWIGPGLKVGISWRGGVPQTNTVARSLTLAQLEPLFATAGTQFVSLQYGDCRAELDAFAAASGHRIHLWQEAIDDYDETAALVSGVDLVVSVCTAVVHLAGALDRPVWVMAPIGPGWRYGREGPGMIWYPSARVFRQQKYGVWDRIIADIANALRDVVKDSGPTR